MRSDYLRLRSSLAFSLSSQCYTGNRGEDGSLRLQKLSDSWAPAHTSSQRWWPCWSHCRPWPSPTRTLHALIMYSVNIKEDGLLWSVRNNMAQSLCVRILLVGSTPSCHRCLDCGQVFKIEPSCTGHSHRVLVLIAPLDWPWWGGRWQMQELETHITSHYTTYCMYLLSCLLTYLLTCTHVHTYLQTFTRACRHIYIHTYMHS